MVTIEHMLLQVTGFSAEDAHKLGVEVAQRLEAAVANRPDLLRPASSIQLGAFDLQLRVPAGLTTSQLADRITAQILEQMA